MHLYIIIMRTIVCGIILIIFLLLLTVKEQKNYLIQLGLNIRKVRKEKGLSQEQLALIAELDRSYVGSIERGTRNASFLTLIKIAKCLNCDVATFTKNLPNE